MEYQAVKIDPDRVVEVHQVITKCSSHLQSNLRLGQYWIPPYPMEMMRRDAQEKDVYAVSSSGRTVATFTLDTKPPSYFDRKKCMAMWQDPGAKAMYVFRLAVLPELQGKGIGSWCMRRIEGIATEARCVAVRLDAFHEYKDLLRFYEKLGYERKGTIWWHDLGAVCFEKVL